MSELETKDVLYALAVTDTLRKIAAESSRYERGVIDAETFAQRVGDLFIRFERNTASLAGPV